MKGYYNGYSYVGWMPTGNGKGRWMFFSTEEEYKEAYLDNQIEIWKRAS